MIAAWMLRMLVATTLIAIGARAAEEAARLLGRPRRWMWAAALSLATALPWLGGVVAVPAMLEGVLGRWLPGSAGPVAPSWPDAVAILSAPTVPTDAGAAGGGAVLDTVLLGGWAFASLAAAFAFGRALRRLHAVRRRGRATRSGGVDIVRSDALGPATVGIIRPTIVLPGWVDELAPEERALIVEHEREHAAARDPGLLAAAALPVLAAPWCAPLWWMHRRLRDAAEADCDARVLARGADRRAYGRALLSAADRPSPTPITAPALAGANITRLRRRILMMTEQRPKHALLRAVPLIAVAVVAAFVACDAAGDATGTAEERGSAITPKGTVEYVGERNDVDPAQRRAALREITLTEAARRARAEAAGTVDGGVVTLRETPDGTAPQAGRTLAEVDGEGDGVRARLREQREVRLRAARAGDLAALIDDDGPLVYIDGVRIGSPSDAAMEELNPNDIERIEVIKGKAAKALFGEAAAGGVIQIYTKKTGS